ncbi:leucine-rich repeat transmembrane neuronal protein 4-like [Petromyzon marinus]|uniref:Leucine-rich repeat transmembrane neuronal protein 3-like n=1 Tax=Petromyzon marinus TaxID=7757 RepID=A0AAJ7SYT8_PETMA|nr:leucine-rich repeat transmembrane neuronal protein 3-like [Petromyzon marinus]
MCSAMGLILFRVLSGPRTRLMIFTAAFILSFPTVEGACSKSCKCDVKIVYCESLGLKGLPRNISAGTLGLSLRYNSLQELNYNQFASFRQLTWLYLDHNYVHTVDAHAFQGIRRLKELILSSNRISNLANGTFRPISNLRNLDLSYNQLQILDPDLFRGLRKLQSLHLRSNTIKTMPVRIFQDCRNLEFLDLGYNRLRSLARNAFAGLTRLTELHMEHNQFSKVNFAHFPRLMSLRHLYLQGNKISEMTQGMVWIWSTLQILDLSGNELQSLRANAFEYVPNLQTLRLDSNKFTTLTHEVLSSLKSLNLISLSGNLWECDRKLCALGSWLTTFGIRREKNMICAGPKHLEGENVMEAIDNYNICGERPRVTAEPTAPAPKPGSRPTGWLKPVVESRIEWGEPIVLTTDPTADFPVHPPPPPLDPDLEAVSLHKVIAGCVALILSVLVILLVIYISWRRYPASMRQLQQQGPLAHHRRQKKRRRRGASNERAAQPTIPLEYYVDYKPTNSEATEGLANGTTTHCSAFIVSAMQECEIPLQTLSAPPGYEPIPASPPEESAQQQHHQQHQQQQQQHQQLSYYSQSPVADHGIHPAQAMLSAHGAALSTQGSQACRHLPGLPPSAPSPRTALLLPLPLQQQQQQHATADNLIPGIVQAASQHGIAEQQR